MGVQILGFQGGEGPEYPSEKPSEYARTNSKFNPHMTPGGNQTRVKLVGGRRELLLLHLPYPL